MTTRVRPECQFPAFHASSGPFSGRTQTDPKMGSIFLKWIGERPKDFAKAIGYTASWLNLASKSSSKTLLAANGQMMAIKDFLGATEIPGKLTSLKAAFVNTTGDNVARVRRVFGVFTGLVNSATDAISLSDRISPISSDLMNKIKGLNSAATLGGSANGIINDLQEIDRVGGVKNARGRKALLDLGRDFSYFLIGGAGVRTYITGKGLRPWVALAGLTSGLLFTIGGHFYTAMHPEELAPRMSPIRGAHS